MEKHRLHIYCLDAVPVEPLPLSGVILAVRSDGALRRRSLRRFRFYSARFSATCEQRRATRGSRAARPERPRSSTTRIRRHHPLGEITSTRATQRGRLSCYRSASRASTTEYQTRFGRSPCSTTLQLGVGRSRGWPNLPEPGFYIPCLRLGLVSRTSPSMRCRASGAVSQAPQRRAGAGPVVELEARAFAHASWNRQLPLRIFPVFSDHERRTN